MQDHPEEKEESDDTPVEKPAVADDAEKPAEEDRQQDTA